jgi:hypothetical protein
MLYQTGYGLAGSSSLPSLPHISTLETLMRSFIAVSVGLLIAVGATAQAAPLVPHRDFTVSAPASTMVRQRCGVGMKRAKAWQDKGGAWHGPCVPKRS